MSYKLLLDTSSEYLSVGIVQNETILYQTSYAAWQRQSELLIPEIAKGLNSLNLKFKDIGEIYVSIGPGSYTGVRIALTVAKTVATVSNIKIVALSSLKVLGRADEDYIALINARSNRSYIGIYAHGKTILKDQVLENEQVLELINEYKNKGYKVYGNVEYLSLQSDGIKIIEGLLTHGSITNYVSDVLSLKPVYLKDEI